MLGGGNFRVSWRWAWALCVIVFVSAIILCGSVVGFLFFIFQWLVYIACSVYIACPSWTDSCNTNMLNNKGVLTNMAVQACFLVLLRVLHQNLCWNAWRMDRATHQACILAYFSCHLVNELNLVDRAQFVGNLFLPLRRRLLQRFEFFSYLIILHGRDVFYSPCC